MSTFSRLLEKKIHHQDVHSADDALILRSKFWGMTKCKQMEKNAFFHRKIAFGDFGRGRKNIELLSSRIRIYLKYNFYLN